MISMPLDDLYLEWLYSEVANVRIRSLSRTYRTLLYQMYKTEFIWWVPNDDNREADGKDLRREFLVNHDIHDPDKEWLELGCSMLEMFIALSRAAAFETESLSREWFWQIVENLNLEQCTDEKYNDRVAGYVDEVLNAVIWRLYKPDGRGGMFPLEQPHNDQREVEIWYQLAAYLMEHE